MLSTYRFSPNLITLGGFLIAALASYAVSQAHLIVAISLWWIGRAFDSLDGQYARATNQTSPFGGYLDITLDMTSYSLFILGLAYFKPEFGKFWLATSVLYTLCITSALALGAAERELARRPRDNRGLRLGAGLAEAGETGIYYTLVCFFPQWMQPLSIAWIYVLSITVITRTILASRL